MSIKVGFSLSASPFIEFVEFLDAHKTTTTEVEVDEEKTIT